MISCVFILLVYLCVIHFEEKINKLYISLFYLVIAVSILTFRLNNIYYLDHFNFSFYTLLLSVFVYFMFALVDILKDRNLDLITYTQYNLLAFTILENNWVTQLLYCLILYLTDTKNIKINSVKKFIFTFLVMVMLSTIYTQELVEFRSISFVLMFITVIILSIENLKKINMYLILFVTVAVSINIFPQECYYILPIMILMSGLQISDEILEILKNKTKIVIDGERIFNKLSYKIENNIIRFSKQKKDFVYRRNINEIVFINFDIRTILTSVMLIVMISFLCIEFFK